MFSFNPKLSDREPRIRFAWGFWDRRNLPGVKKPPQIDKFYSAGWDFGGYTNYGNGENAALEAWSDFRKIKKNPPRQKNPSISTVIYGRVLAVEAQKTGKHLCDAECKRYQHRYRHDFKKGAVMYGLDDGSILIRAK